MRPGGCLFNVDTSFGVGGTIKALDAARAQRLDSEFSNCSTLAVAFSFGDRLQKPPPPPTRRSLPIVSPRWESAEVALKTEGQMWRPPAVMCC